MRTIAIQIDGDETDCIPDGVPCRHLRTQRYGGSFHCKLFSDSETDIKGNYEELRDQHGTPSGEGRLQRHRDCLAQDIT